MRKKLEQLVHFGVKAALAAALPAALSLTWAAGRYTHEYPADYSVEKITIRPDSLLLNLLWAGAAAAVLYLLRKLLLRRNTDCPRTLPSGSGKHEAASQLPPKDLDSLRHRKALVFAALAETIVIGGLLCLWTAHNRAVPQADQESVYLCARSFLEGNYEPMREGGYLWLYPHQYGITFLYEMLFRLVPQADYRLIQYLNVVFISLTVYYGFRLTDELFRNQAADLVYLFLMPAFFPIYFYSVYVYGDVIALPMGVAGCLSLLRWCRGGRVRDAAVCVCAVSFSILAKKNAQIFLIGFLLALLLHLLKIRQLKTLLFMAVLAVSPFLCLRGVETYYERCSGLEVSEGIPSLLWIVMGTQQSPRGAGVYNNYVYVNFVEAGYDASLSTKRGLEDLRNRAEEFRRDPPLFADFYKDKFLSQWNDQTFGGMMMTSRWETPPSGFVEQVYFGGIQRGLLAFLNRYLFLLYLGASLAILQMLAGRAEPEEALPVIIFLGGVLFSLLWEAKSRYVLSYVVLLLPFMARGIVTLQDTAVRSAAFLRGRF